MNPDGLLLIAIGSFAISGAFFDWEWFMNHHKARFLTAIFGRTGARTFYCLLGSGLVIFGMLIAAGFVHGL